MQLASLGIINGVRVGAVAAQECIWMAPFSWSINVLGKSRQIHAGFRLRIGWARWLHLPYPCPVCCTFRTAFPLQPCILRCLVCFLRRDLQENTSGECQATNPSPENPNCAVEHKCIRGNRYRYVLANVSFKRIPGFVWLVSNNKHTNNSIVKNPANSQCFLLRGWNRQRRNNNSSIT